MAIHNSAAEQLSEEERKKELQGVFVVEGDEAVFHEVETGITGATDIEVLERLWPTTRRSSRAATR